ncbi:MAG: Eco57I restriction-modification methylase domain-containing protein [Saprospiraceae bacterium]|nr:Eco57I restriction-modification methylase domain-containing protein [Saprospiraceae bacterium]
MSSLTRQYNRQKLTGQVYTPAFVVGKILDDTGFDHAGVLGSPVLDPACGDGRFLEAIVQRIIGWSPKAGLAAYLAQVHGWDIDPQALADCRARLDALTDPLGLRIDWNLRCCDALHQEAAAGQFDFIVGNPPYIRIQHLEPAQRQYIRAHFEFCRSGSTDIYIAFYELATRLLAPGGRCGFITPNTFFFTETARPLRAYFAGQQNLLQLTNYGDIQVFDNATTYSAIAVFGTEAQPCFRFEQALDKNAFTSQVVGFEKISEKKFWQLGAAAAERTAGKRLKDVARIHVGITTLCDKAYFFPVEELDGQYVWALTKLQGRVKMERGILKPLVKASTLKSGDEPIREYALFPYEKHAGKTRLIAETELRQRYPLAYAYLCAVRPDLDRRDNGRPVKPAWYAYARSQGLETSFGRKILFSPMNRQPNFILHEREDATFYSGYCIKYDGDYRQLLEQLNSPRMAEFIAVSGRDFRGGWKAYNKKVMEEFPLAD